MFNFSAEPQSVVITEALAGDYKCACGSDMSFAAGEVVELAPWGYMLLNK
jgi:hypothetical protein